jgi:glycosyltransferase involved in cell wall biosynthesis
MNTGKKTLLVVAPYFPPHSGGLERYAFEVSKRLMRTHEWRVVVLTTSETGVESTEDMSGITVRRLQYGFKLSNTPFSFRWFLRVPQILREVRPDLIDIHLPVPGIGDVVGLFAGNTPIVVHYHAGSMRKGRLFLDLLITLYEKGPLKLLLNKAQAIVCSSDYVRHGLLARVAEKSVTITPATDTQVFFPEASKPERPTIVFVGGLGSGELHKGLYNALNSVVTLRKDIPTLTLTVVGEGDMQDEYRAYAQKHGILDAVSFVGKATGDSMALQYRGAQVFALPTTNDSFPTVILEAMASGLPVVSTRVGSISTMVEDGVTGFVVNPGDERAFTDALRNIFADPVRAHAMGQAGRERVCKSYSWDERVQAHHELFTQVLAPKHSIAHIVGYYPPHVGGMEVVAEELAHALAHRHHMVRVFTSSVGGSPGIERDTGIIVHRLRSIEFAHTPILWTLPFRLALLPPRTRVHVHIAQLGIPEVALLISNIRHFPFIAHFHLDVEPSGLLGPLFLLYKKYVLGYVLRHAERVIVFSDEQARLVAEKHGVHAHVIRIVPNGVAEPYFLSETRTYGNGPLQILSVGRLANQKRIDRIIEAVSRMSEPAHLTIVGDGEDRAELEALAERLCPGKVTFVGKCSPEEVRAYQRTAQVFVLPSDKEGMPLSALEAMASGLPVVGSNVLGIRELVQGVGILVDAPYPESFARALDTLARDPALCARLSLHSSQHAIGFTWERVVEKLEEIYREL